MSDQFTLSQPEEADYAHHINTGTPGIPMDNRPAYCVPCQRSIAEPGEVNQGIDQSKLVPLLVAALQEQNDLIDDLRARVAQLESN